MDFILTNEQELLQKLARQFAVEVCEPEAAMIDQTHEFPMETWKKMAQIGLLQVNHACDYGGTGIDPIAEMIVIEELSKASLTHGAMYALLAHGFPTFIEKFGTEEQKRRFIPRVIIDGMIGGFCLTEPDVGSDATAVRTSSRKSGNGYIVNGTKCFITAGDISEYLIVVAKADALNGEKGFTGFIVDTKLPGVSAGRRENKMGICALPTTEVVFTDVFVSEECILGGIDGVGKMMHYALGTLDAARIGTGAQALGVATAAYELAVAYSTERKQFGKPICANQGLAWYIADMACKLDMSRLLVYRAACMERDGQSVSKEAAMAKLYATKFGKEVVDMALQIHGGYGYMKDAPLERMYRDIKITEIYEGTSEILKIVIANGILPRPQKKTIKK